MAEVNDDYCRLRDVRLARALNPSLLGFDAWVSRTGTRPDRLGAAMEPHELIFSITNAGVAARCLHVVAELGVADHIQDRPVPASELAQRCAVDPDGLNRVLRLLSAHGVFSCASGGYQHSPASRLLRSDNPMSMRAFPR